MAGLRPMAGDIRRSARAMACLAAGLLAPALAVADSDARRDTYRPALALTPDGCQVWVMDDGAEGFAWYRTTPDGRPVCGQVETCLVAAADTLFASGSAAIPPAQAARLAEFFRQPGIAAFTVSGHTDSRGAEIDNIDLSVRRAAAVARVATGAGARVTAVHGFGETRPRASNATPEGRAQNRRVEVQCHRRPEMGR